tara:strand:+ start:9718 stop:10344 length:627 start_codon:yes stop_codon:yes gene_type:complete
MTGGRHYAWRKIAVEMLEISNSENISLDIATGTGDFALEIINKNKDSFVIGVDTSLKMIEIARTKSKKLNYNNINFALSDAHNLPFPDEFFSYATIGFGVRNFIDLKSALNEVNRVLMPNSKLVILEIVKLNQGSILSKLFPIYFGKITPWLGSIFAGDKEAYSYLPQSVENFISSKELTEVLNSTGFKTIKTKKIALGTVTIHIAQK